MPTVSASKRCELCKFYEFAAEQRGYCLGVLPAIGKRASHIEGAFMAEWPVTEGAWPGCVGYQLDTQKFRRFQMDSAGLSVVKQGEGEE